MVHLVAAIGWGAEEVGADALAEAFTSFGTFGLTVEDLALMLGTAERGEGPSVDWGLLQQHADMRGRVLRASDEELVRARTVLLGLRMFYWLYMMHGLFMPDTPALAALRNLIDECGMGPVLDHAVALNPSARQLGENLAVCLGPPFDGCTTCSWSSSRKTRRSSVFPATTPDRPASWRRGYAPSASSPGRVRVEPGMGSVPDGPGRP
ncbi:hypothetical protein SCANM63S_03539 [Streptomyces canarius]